jgi:hypothetical protein
MPNTFTALQPLLFSVAQEVSNEPTGVLQSIDMRFDDKGVAIGDTVRVPVAPVATSSTYTPSMTVTAGSDLVAGAVDVQITGNDQVSWHLTGEQIKSLENGSEQTEWIRQVIAQAMRRLRNNAEVAAAAAVKVGASRAFGTAGTTPFASDLSALTNARKILQDNGAPLVDLQMVVDTSASLNLRNLGVVQNSYQAGSDAERRSGNLLPQFGFSIRESAQLATHTKGTGASYVTSGSTAIGATGVALVTGTGTVLAGDVVTFAADTANRYVVGTGVTAPGTIALNRPGARVTIPTANALTIGNNYVPNLAFERTAVVGIMRPPMIPVGGVISRTTPISDSTGMTYLLVEAIGDGMITWRLHLAYGFRVVQPEHVAIIMG